MFSRGTLGSRLRSRSEIDGQSSFLSPSLSKMEVGLQRWLVFAVKGKSLLLAAARVLQVLLGKYAASFVELINLAWEVEGGRKRAPVADERMRDSTDSSTFFAYCQRLSTEHLESGLLTISRVYIMPEKSYIQELWLVFRRDDRPKISNLNISRRKPVYRE